MGLRFNLRSWAAAVWVAALVGGVPCAGWGKWVERRVKPVAYASCATTETATGPTALWDGRKTIEDKWTCMHAGERTPQTHWVVMDLGRAFPVTRIVIYHEGFAAADSAHLNTEDFSLFHGNQSLAGPWDPIAVVDNNTASFSQIPAGNTVARFVKLEVRDPMVGSVPDSPNDDWVLRLLELEVFAAWFEADGASTATAAAAETSRPLALSRLYYFYQGDHARSRSFYDEVVRKPAHRDLVARFEVIPVDMAGDPARAVRMSVYKSPTLVIESFSGSEQDRLQGIPSEMEFTRFLRANTPVR